VQALHPRLDRLEPVASTSTGAPANLDVALANLSLAPADSPGPDERAYFISLFLLHAHLLPAFTSTSTSSTPSSASASSAPLSAFLPALFALLRSSDLPPPTSLYPRPQHTSPHITYLLALYHALLRLSSASLARLFSPAHVPPLPPAVAALARTLHLPSSFHPTSALLRRGAPRVRDALLWPPLRRAYKFPPDPVDWVARGLLFQCEVEGELVDEDEGRDRGGGPALAAGERGRAGEVRGSWEDEADELEAPAPNERGRRVREEAERRAVLYVKERLASSAR